MFLHSVHLDPRCREARRDLADAYQMHATLSRAFSAASERCPPGEFLWRLESTRSSEQSPQLLVQSRKVADWSRVDVAGWLSCAAPPIDLRQRFKLDALRVGRRFRFRLRANPSVMRERKRQGLLQREEQEQWLLRKANQHGFSVQLLTSGAPSVGTSLADVHISQKQMLTARKHDHSVIRLYTVLYDGALSVTDVERFTMTLQTGIGHGKSFGLGLLSVVPIK